jgi:hypothetical protein
MPHHFPCASSAFSYRFMRDPLRSLLQSYVSEAPGLYRREAGHVLPSSTATLAPTPLLTLRAAVILNVSAGDTWPDHLDERARHGGSSSQTVSYGDGTM